MKKYLLVLLLLASPLIGQELEQQKNKKELYVETGIFTRIEGISQPSLSLTLKPDLISLTAFEFSIGKENIYFYSQLRFSTALPNYRQVNNISLSPMGAYYGRRIGFLIGLGGEIYDSRPDQIAQKFTMSMNLGVGADFTLDKVLQDMTLSSPIAPDIKRDYKLDNYYTIEWNWMMKYHFKKNFGIQWGVNLALSGDDSQTRDSFLETGIIDPSEPLLLRYGFSLGLVF